MARCIPSYRREVAIRLLALCSGLLTNTTTTQQLRIEGWIGLIFWFGAGVAGLSAAIRLAGVGSVLVVTKEELAESNTAYAQGGIAVAMGGEEDVALHLEDTIAAGDGLVNREAAALLVEQGPERVEELLAWGTAFDRYPAAAGMRLGS